MKGKKWYVGIMIMIVLLNVYAWNSESFSDWYRLWIFRPIENAYGHFSSLFPFSLGELLIAVGVLLVVLSVVLALALLFGKGLFRKQWTGLTAFTRSFYHGMLWLLLAVALVMSSNCFVLYHCSGFDPSAREEMSQAYNVKKLVILRDYVIKRANTLSKKMARDENGYLVYNQDMIQQAKAEMTKMGESYALLRGYYPTPKQITTSKFLSQQYIMGYYFPFSMEANYNGEMYISNVPVTLCHEMSHVKGFMYEDDANFIAYLACVNSEDIFFQYSGYLSVIDYLNNDLYESLDRNKARYKQYVQCNKYVQKDNVFLTPEAWLNVEKTAVVSTSVVKKASKTFLDTNLNMNGIEEGIASYSNVVERMLVYYDGELY